MLIGELILGVAALVTAIAGAIATLKRELRKSREKILTQNTLEHMENRQLLMEISSAAAVAAEKAEAAHAVGRDVDNKLDNHILWHVHGAPSIHSSMSAGD